MATQDIIVIGGSAGSIDVLRRLCAGLPAGLPASIFVVVHVGAQGRDLLAAALDGAGPLTATTAEDGERFEHGRIYVAPADRHLLLGDGVIRLGRGPRENMARPAIDALFRSAAAAYGPRVTGVVLSGHLNDGASGLSAVKQCGGLTVVQSPSDAEAQDMPLQAMENCDVDYRAAKTDLAGLLTALAGEPAGPVLPVPAGIAIEVAFALGRQSESRRLRQVAEPSTIPCPSCGGVLSEMHEKEPLRFRCQVGHAYTAEFVDQEQERLTQEALVVALRALDSRATLMERMAADALAKGRVRSAAEFDDRARDYRRDADTIHAALVRTDAVGFS